MENHVQLESIFTSWQQAVLQRVGQHAFTQSSQADGSSTLGKLLRRIFDLHYRNPAYAYVTPPLPELPLMPLDQRWVELRLAESERTRSYTEQLLRSAEAHSSQSATVSVERVLSGHESLAIIGEPGAGKTTMLKWAARYLIGEPRSLCLIPLYIQLRSYSAWLARNPEGDFYRFFAAYHRLTDDEAEVFWQFMMDVEAGPQSLRYLCRVMLDGWDEVPVAQRPNLLRSLERFEWFLPAIITSRPSGSARSLPPAFTRRYEVAPLSFESMRALMCEWFGQAGKPQLESELCRHLDEHLSLRDLARNPFVLTLLCAVITGNDYVALHQLPPTRALLYQSALRLFAEYCDGHFRHDGFPFTAEVMHRTEHTAFELFQREEASPYEFSLADVARVAGDEKLAPTLERARLITLTKDYEQQYTFLHATVHEFLTAAELRRRLADGRLDWKTVGVSAKWLQVVLFLFGLEGVTDESGITKSLARFCYKPDRFGLILVRVAHLLAEARVTDGGQQMLGVDLRVKLWELFLQAPDARPYAEALLELDSDFVLDHAQELVSVGPGAFKKLTLLHLRISPHHPRRSELIKLTVALRMRPTEILEDPDVEDFAAYLGFSALAAVNLTTANESRNPAQIIEELAGITDAPRRRAYRMRLALSRCVEAEEYLIERLSDADESELEELAESLATLGTLKARDALLAVIPRFSTNPKHLAPLLKALFDLPLTEGAEMILRFAAPSYPQEIRVNAAMTMGRSSGARSDGVLNKLSDYARLEEPDGAMRKAVLLTLARAKSFAMIRCLANEGIRQRTEPGEFKIAWDYVLAMAAEINPAKDYSQSLSLIEQMLIEELDRAVLASTYVVAQAWTLGKASRPVSERLLKLIDAEDSTLEIRAAACQAVSKLRLPKARRPLLTTLNDCLTDTTRLPLAQAAARALAALAPTSLLKKKHPVIEQALWQMSVETGRMVIGQRIIDPENIARSVRRTRLPEKFRVALTFAGEQRSYVAEVAQHLAKQIGRKNVFYDEWYSSSLAQADLDLRLIEIYRQADLVVPFLSADYEKKMWCRLEWRAVRSLLLERRNDVMFCRFDEVEIPGLFLQDGYLDLRRYDPLNLVRMILERLSR